jgi:hypothetical protein
MRAGGLILDRGGQEQVADALETGAPELLVRNALGLERRFELLAALALTSQHRREVFGVAGALSLEKADLTQLRFVLEAHGLLAAVHLGKVAGHANSLGVRLIRDTDRLLQQLTKDLAGNGRTGRRHDDSGRDLDHFDRHPLGLFLWHRRISCARGSRG